MDTSSLTPQKHYHQGIFPTVLLQPSFLRVAGRSRAYPLPQLTFPGDELEGGAIARPGFSGGVVNVTGHAGGASDPTIIPDANAASRAPGCSALPPGGLSSNRDA